MNLTSRGENLNISFLLFSSVSQQSHKQMKGNSHCYLLFKKLDVEQSSLKYRLNNKGNNYIFHFFSLSAKLSDTIHYPSRKVSEKTE